jgi:hypothetical protein
MRPIEIALVPLLALASCGKASVPGPSLGGSGLAPGCQSSGAGTPLANLGPDLNLPVLCRMSARGAVASVDQEGPGATTWAVSLDGDPHFSLEGETFVTCEGTSPTVAMVDLQAEFESVPGETYDAVATISAVGDVFPTTRVAIHGEVEAPRVSAPTSVDFGDVPAWTLSSQMVRFINSSPAPVAIVLGPDDPLPFSFAFGDASKVASSTTPWLIELQPSPPGDYTVTTSWTATPNPMLTFPPACLWTQTITLHAHVVDAPDAGADGSPDAGADEYTGSRIIP